jgi:hypothetical protein
MAEPKNPAEPQHPDPLHLEFRKVEDELELDLDLPAVVGVTNGTIKADSGGVLPGTGNSRSRHIILGSHVDVRDGRLVARVRVRSPQKER